MRRCIGWAAALYPARWREEYGDEYRGLLDELQPNWRTFANVLMGALAMQAKSGSGWMKAIALAGVSGAVVACALSFWTMPVAYRSSATMQVRPVADPLRPASAQDLEKRAAVSLAGAVGEILSRTTLEGLIRNPALDLYASERRSKPMEQIVERMRRDIHLRLAPPGPAPGPIEFSVSFDYPDRKKAQMVTSELLARFVETNQRVSRVRARLYQIFWSNQVQEGRAPAPPPPPSGENLDVVIPPSAASATSQEGRAIWIALGAAAGALLAALLLRARRRPHGIWLLAGSAATGMLLAAAVTFLLPTRYSSVAVLRVTQPSITPDPLSVARPATAAEWLRNFGHKAINRETLQGVIQKLDLYATERSREPLQQIAQHMLDHDLRVEPASLMSVPGSVTEFQVSFSYPEPDKARGTVRELVGLLTSGYVMELRARWQNLSPLEQDIESRKAGENLDVIDPPSLPESPDRPNRSLILMAGLGLGLLAGSIALRPRMTPQPS